MGNVTNEECLSRVDSIKDHISSEVGKVYKKLDDIVKTQNEQAVDIAVIKTKVDERTSKVPHFITGGATLCLGIVSVWLKEKLGIK